MAYSPIGDTIALTKLAYTLYSRVIIVARHAPDQFDDLIRDLDVYKRVLYRIQSRVEDASDKSYGVAVHNVLAECFRALHRLGALTTKYENLGEPFFPACRVSSCTNVSKHGVTVAISSSALLGPKTKRQLKAFARHLENNSSYSSSPCRPREGK